MSDHDRTHDHGDTRVLALLEHADEHAPPMSVHPEGIVETGRRKVRRTRGAAVGVGALALAGGLWLGNGLLPGINVRSASIDGSEGYAINVKSPNQQAALAWLQFAASDVAQSEIVGQEGWFPVSQKTLDDPATAKALPVIRTYRESTKYQTKRYGTPWSSELDQLLSVQIFKAMNQETEPKAALDAAQEQLKPIIDRYMK